MGRVRGVVDRWIKVELIPIFCGGRVKGDLLQVLVCWRVEVGKLIQRKLADFLNLAAKFGSVTINRITQPAVWRGKLYIRHDPVESLVPCERHGGAQQFIRHANATWQRTGYRLPSLHVGAAKYRVFGIHRAYRQGQC